MEHHAKMSHRDVNGGFSIESLSSDPRTPPKLPQSGFMRTNERLSGMIYNRTTIIIRMEIAVSSADSVSKGIEVYENRATLG